MEHFCVSNECPLPNEHFEICPKELAEVFKKQFNFLGENTEK